MCWQCALEGDMDELMECGPQEPGLRLGGVVSPVGMLKQIPSGLNRVIRDAEDDREWSTIEDPEAMNYGILNIAWTTEEVAETRSYGQPKFRLGAPAWWEN